MYFIVCNCTELISVQLYRAHQCSRFISAIAFVSRHICFKRNLAQVITYLYKVGFECELNSWPDSSVG